MTTRMNTFTKMIILLLSLLIPIIILYGYSHQVSVNVVRQEIENANSSRLSFFMTQMESTVDQLTKFSIISSRDPLIREYMKDDHNGSPLERWQKQMRIMEILNLHSVTSEWTNQIVLFMPDKREAISTDFSVLYNSPYIEHTQLNKWTYQNSSLYVSDRNYFSFVSKSDDSNLLIEVRFSDDNVKNMLRQLKQGGSSEPFLFSPGKELLLNQTDDQKRVNQVVVYLNHQQIGRSGTQVVTLDKEKYVVNYVQSKSLGWYLVDYVPLQKILLPITLSKNLFYVSVGLLLVLSVLAASLLYRNVQRPIQLLIRGVQRLKEGHYMKRLHEKPNNEFDFLFFGFNQMAIQIQQLIEKVYMETIRSREATLKQLQSQINPHFLYNCLFHIKNMASLGHVDAVMEMAYHLGEYYRYTTRVETPLVTLKDEIKLIENYLHIQNSRMERFHYEIEIPEEMLANPILKLLIQPVVENAIIHGIEESLSFGIIHIKAGRKEGMNYIIVEDNGPGMSLEKMEQLQKKLILPMDDTMGCGLWNIHQRLLLRYKRNSGIYLTPSSLGGLRVELVWCQDELTE